MSIRCVQETTACANDTRHGLAVMTPRRHWGKPLARAATGIARPRQMVALMGPSISAPETMTYAVEGRRSTSMRSR